MYNRKETDECLLWGACQAIGVWILYKAGQALMAASDYLPHEQYKMATGAAVLVVIMGFILLGLSIYNLSCFAVDFQRDLRKERAAKAKRRTAR